MILLVEVVDQSLTRVGTTAVVGTTAERPAVFDYNDPFGSIEVRTVVGAVVFLIVYGFFEVAWIRLFHAELMRAPISAREATNGAAARIGQLILVHLALGVIVAGSAAAIMILAFEQPLTALLTVPVAIGLATAALPHAATALAAGALTPSSKYVLPAARHAVAGRWEFGLCAVVISILPGSAVATALMPLDQFEFPILDTLLRAVAAAACAAVQAASLAAVYHALGGWAADVEPE